MALTTGHHHHQLDREDLREMPSSEGKSEMMAPYPAVEATPFLPSRSYRGSKSHHLQSVDKLGAFALRANDDETNTCREFTLEGIGQTSSGYAPNQRQQDSCSSRR